MLTMVHYRKLFLNQRHIVSSKSCRILPGKSLIDYCAYISKYLTAQHIERKYLFAVMQKPLHINSLWSHILFSFFSHSHQRGWFCFVLFFQLQNTVLLHQFCVVFFFLPVLEKDIEHTNLPYSVCLIASFGQ